MNHRIYLTLILISTSLSSICQKVDNDSTLFEIRNKITKFFIERGVLNNKISEKENYVFSYEIAQKKMIGFNEIGVYRIGVLQSHSDQHVLIKEGFKIKIFDLVKIDSLLKEVLNFCTKYNIKNEVLITYLNEIISMYKIQYLN